MVTPDTLSIWLRQQALPIGILLMLTGVVLLILKLSAVHRRAVLSRDRNAVTEQTFVEHLAQYNFDPLVAGATYRYLQEVQRIQFPILPSDALDEDLGLDSDDLEQAITELLYLLHRREVRGLRYAPVSTVEDLVRHLQASPRMSQQMAA